MVHIIDNKVFTSSSEVFGGGRPIPFGTLGPADVLSSNRLRFIRLSKVWVLQNEQDSVYMGAEGVLVRGFLRVTRPGAFSREFTK